jgi:hypothetical protein
MRIESKRVRLVGVYLDLSKVGSKTVGVFQGVSETAAKFGKMKVMLLATAEGPRLVTLVTDLCDKYEDNADLFRPGESIVTIECVEVVPLGTHQDGAPRYFRRYAVDVANAEASEEPIAEPTGAPHAA